MRIVPDRDLADKAATSGPTRANTATLTDHRQTGAENVPKTIREATGLKEPETQNSHQNRTGYDMPPVLR